MRVDVSEIKEYRTCHRKWQYSSRNFYHMRPVKPLPALKFGTLFHEGLHALYSGSTIEKVLEVILPQLDDITEVKVMENMLTGYFAEVLPHDRDKYDILEIEYSWQFDNARSGVTLCGSIDMIVVDKETHEVFGFEHKSARSFKNPMMIKMDEQPRLYFIALKKYVEALNEKKGTDYYKVGGIYLNEVKKVQRKLDIQRTLCIYSEADQQRFMVGITNTCLAIADNGNRVDQMPEPSPIKCQMCQYAEICEHFQYDPVTVESIQLALPEVFEVRLLDHLDEKSNKDYAIED